MKSIITLVICTGALVLGNASMADTLVVPVGQQGKQQSIDKPQSGTTKTQVKQQFGEPNGWRPAVGQPPISSWVYDGFTVYFEYDRVIHTVLTR